MESAGGTLGIMDDFTQCGDHGSCDSTPALRLWDWHTRAPRFGVPRAHDFAGRNSTCIHCFRQRGALAQLSLLSEHNAFTDLRYHTSALLALAPLRFRETSEPDEKVGVVPLKDLESRFRDPKLDIWCFIKSRKKARRSFQQPANLSGK